MSALVSINLQIRDTASRDLRDRMAVVQNPRGLMAAAGGTVRRVLQDHFRAKNAQGNKQGWPSRGTWKRIASATQLTSVTASEAVVTVAAPEFSLKLNGGTITPKRGKALAIPANAEAYKLGSPRASGLDLVAVILGNTARGKVMGALVRPAQQQVSFRKTKKGGLKAHAGKLTPETVMYWLVRSARVPRDNDALPSQQKLQATLDDTVRQWFAQQTRRAAS